MCATTTPTPLRKHGNQDICKCVSYWERRRYSCCQGDEHSQDENELNVDASSETSPRPQVQADLIIIIIQTSHDNSNGI